MNGKDVKNRALENAYILTESMLEWIECALDGKAVSDFAMTFPIVRKAYDLKKAHSEMVVEKTQVLKGSETET